MVRLSEMDSGSIVFAGRTGRGGKTAGGVGCYEGEEARGRVGGTSGSGDVEVGEWKVALGGTGGGGDGGRKTCVSSRNFLTAGS